MRKLFAFACAVLLIACGVIPASATPLPQCEGRDISKWTDCSGVSLDERGGFYAGEWKAGQREGRGILVDKVETATYQNFHNNARVDVAVVRLGKDIRLSKDEYLATGASNSVKGLRVGMYRSQGELPTPVMIGPGKAGISSDVPAGLVVEAKNNAKRALALEANILADYTQLRDSGAEYVRQQKGPNASLAQSAVDTSAQEKQHPAIQESTPQVAPNAEASQDGMAFAGFLAVCALVFLMVFVLPIYFGAKAFRKNYGMRMPWPLALLLPGFVVGPLFSLAALINYQQDTIKLFGYDVFKDQIQPSLNGLYVLGLVVTVLGWIAAASLIRRGGDNAINKLVFLLWLCGPVHALIVGVVTSGLLSGIAPKNYSGFNWAINPKVILNFLYTVVWSFYLLESKKVREIYAVPEASSPEIVASIKTCATQPLATQESVPSSEVTYLSSVGNSFAAVDRSPMTYVPASEEEVYDLIAKEIDDDALHRATWTKAFAEADGDRDRAKARYIKLRFTELYHAPGDETPSS